jgi:hypothetical protein
MTEDFEVHKSGTFKTLDEKDMEIQRLRSILRQIAGLDYVSEGLESTGFRAHVLASVALNEQG